jgi:hypothetical protein
MMKLFAWYKTEFGLTIPFLEVSHEDVWGLAFKTHDWIDETWKRVPNEWESLEIWEGQYKPTKQRPNQLQMHLLINYLFTKWKPPDLSE